MAAHWSRTIIRQRREFCFEKMNAPHVRHTISVENGGGTFVVLAYRKLTPQEVNDCVVSYLSQGRKRNKYPKKGEVITIHTLIGTGGDDE